MKTIPIPIQFDRKGKNRFVEFTNTLTANDPLRTLGNNNPITAILVKVKERNDTIEQEKV